MCWAPGASGLIDVRPLLCLGQKLPLAPRRLLISELYSVVLLPSAPLASGPYHEGIHGSLDVVRRFDMVPEASGLVGSAAARQASLDAVVGLACLSVLSRGLSSPPPHRRGGQRGRANREVQLIMPVSAPGCAPGGERGQKGRGEDGWLGGCRCCEAGAQVRESLGLSGCR